MSNKSSQRWLKEHFSDVYVKQAKLKGYRSRSAYKLLELQQRDKLFTSKMVIVDLGAAPGGWSQVLSEVLTEGKIFALDILPMEPIEGVEFIQGDFTESAIFETLMKRLNDLKSDWVISDMSPNLSGNECTDIPKSIYLGELAFDFALKVLKPSGGLLMKVFQGEDFDQLLMNIKQHFENVSIRKPKASRGRSREVYILARNLKVPDGCS